MGILDWLFGKKETTSESKKKVEGRGRKKLKKKKTTSSKRNTTTKVKQKSLLSYKFKRYNKIDDISLSNMLIIKQEDYMQIKSVSKILKDKGEKGTQFKDKLGQKKIWYDWEAMKDIFTILSKGFADRQLNYRQIVMKIECYGACIYDFGAMDSELLEQITVFVFSEISIKKLDKEFQSFLLRDTKKEIDILKKIYKKQTNKDTIQIDGN